MASKRDLEYRKKKRVWVHRDAPFPVPISTITGTPSDENFWFNFTGYLQHNSVIVCCSGDIKYLHKMVMLLSNRISQSICNILYWKMQHTENIHIQLNLS